MVGLEAKECQGLTRKHDASRHTGTRSFLRVFKGAMALPTLQFQTSSLQDSENKFLLFLSQKKKKKTKLYLGD